MGERMRSSNIYVVTLILAACSIIYELMAAQALSQLAGNTVKWYSLTIGVYLGAMGTGALLVERLTKRWGTWNTLCYVEIALSIAGALAIPLIYFAHVTHSYFYLHAHPLMAQLVFFGSTFSVIFLIGILTGFELPLLIKAGNAIYKRVKLTNRVFGVDYLGSLLGAILFPLLLVPNISLITIGLLVSGVNTAVALWLIVNPHEKGISRLPKLAGAGSVAVALLVCLSSLASIQQYFMKKYYYYREAGKQASTLFMPMVLYPKIIRERSPYQRIDIVEDVGIDERNLLIDAYSTKFIEEPDYPFNTVVFLNGDFQFSSRHDEIYHEYFAHVPLIRANKVPEEVLVLGGGDGLLIKELLKYKQIRSIVHVDLDPEFVRLAKTQPQLLAMNHRALLDPRVATTIGDAYQYIRHLDRKYDAIYIDFPDPADYNLAKLYSAEFFRFVWQHLTPGGFAVFDSTGTATFTPLKPNSPREILPGRNPWPIYYNTLKKAGFENIIPYVSTMGFKNDKARAVLEERLPLVSKEGWDTARGSDEFASWENYFAVWNKSIEDTMNSYVVALEQGFIMMVNGDLPGPVEFHDFGVKMHVLNAERYRLSLGFKYDQPKEIDTSMVNSIMRPTLPIIGIRNIRLPRK